jgi:Fe2+ transport system protein B
MKGRIVNDYLFLFIIVFLAIFINMVTYERQRESFIPLINEVYKPGLRNVRNYASDKIENFTTRARVFMKRFKLI